jgi:hypothetical protein
MICILQSLYSVSRSKGPYETACSWVPKCVDRLEGSAEASSTRKSPQRTLGEMELGGTLSNGTIWRGGG